MVSCKRKLAKPMIPAGITENLVIPVPSERNLSTKLSTSLALVPNFMALLLPTGLKLITNTLLYRSQLA